MKLFFVKYPKTIDILLWLLGCFAFFLLLSFGYFTYQGEVVYFSEYTPQLYKNTQNSIYLIFPAIAVTFILTFIWLGLRFTINSIMWLDRWFRFFCIIFSLLIMSVVLWSLVISLFYSIVIIFLELCLICFLLRFSIRLCTLIDSIPTIFSAIPLFITAIFFIRYFKLDTLHSYNFFYGVICLSLFNMSYLYHKLKKCIEEQYQKPYVAYAKSMGVSRKDILQYYVIPGILPYILSTLRELLPHVIVESIVIEYTFSYNALLRSAVQAIQYDNWHYLVLFFCVVALLISFFEIICSPKNKSIAMEAL